MSRSQESLQAELRDLHALNRRSADTRTEQRMVELRAALFTRRMTQHACAPEAPGVPIDVAPSGLAVTRRSAVNASLVRQAIAQHGALHVEGLLDPPHIERLRGVIDAALDAQDRRLSGAPPEAVLPWYSQSELIHGGLEARQLVWTTGSVLAVDSPRGLFQLLDLYLELGVDRLVADYFGERPALSSEKTTLRRVVPEAKPAGWHQDGAFLGADIRSLNVWIALTDCGADAPGLELVPRRLESILPMGTEGAPLYFCVSPILIEKEFPGATIRPRFKAGDALLFDHFLLHRTFRHQHMPHPRYAIESWFFAPSAYPEAQTGLFV